MKQVSLIKSMHMYMYGFFIKQARGHKTKSRGYPTVFGTSLYLLV